MDKVIRNLDLIDAGKKPENKKDGGMMKKNLKPVDKEKNPGLAKLPTEVRNKMGYMKDGGSVTDKILTGDKKRYKDLYQVSKEFLAKKGKTHKESLLEK